MTDCNSEEQSDPLPEESGSQDGALVDELLQSHPAFQALVAKSKAASRKPFSIRSDETDS
jgi:hypothetical protein